jgi:hypothetical protein
MSLKAPRLAHDLDGLARWLTREPWEERLVLTMEEHFTPAMGILDLEFEELQEALGDHWAAIVGGCAFEDFLTGRFGEQDENPVEAYLHRRGYREPVANKAYMAALKSSVMSLYEVSDIAPGHSLRARDLIRGGEPVLVSERSATRSLAPWTHIAARIVPQGARLVLSGGLLPFTSEASAMLFAMMRVSCGHAFKGRRKPRPSPNGLVGWIGSDADLREAAALFTSAWLLDVLPRTLDPQLPKMVNAEGDEIVFHTVRFPLPRAARGEVARRLGAAAEFHAESSSFWHWLGGPTPAPASSKGGEALFLNTLNEHGGLVLGALELKPGALTLNVNSASRAERGTALLRDTLGDLVGRPLTALQTFEQLMASGPKPSAPPALDIPAEVKERLVHETLDKHYRAVLDQPVPVLGGATPRAAAASARRRGAVVEWLKSLERSAGSRYDPLATYDFAWMWVELGVEHLRR